MRVVPAALLDSLRIERWFVVKAGARCAAACPSMPACTATPRASPTLAP